MGDARFGPIRLSINLALVRVTLLTAGCTVGTPVAWVARAAQLTERNVSRIVIVYPRHGGRGYADQDPEVG